MTLGYGGLVGLAGGEPGMLSLRPRRDQVAALAGQRLGALRIAPVDGRIGQGRLDRGDLAAQRLDLGLGLGDLALERCQRGALLGRLPARGLRGGPRRDSSPRDLARGPSRARRSARHSAR